MYRISLLSLSSAVLALDCFTPNGTSRNAMIGYPEVGVYAPCDSGAKHSMCCRIGGYTSGKDVCIHNNMFCANGDQIWRESCTDPTWQDPACQRLFINGTGYPGAGISYIDGGVATDVQITICDDGLTYCYGYNNRACCQAKQGVYLDSNGTQRTTNPNTTNTSATLSSSSSSASGSTSPSSSASSPTHTASSSNSGLSSGAKAGIGAGIGVAALAAIVILAFLFMRRKRKQKQALSTKSPLVSAPNPVEAPSNSGIAEKYGGNLYSERAELDGSTHPRP